MCSRRLIAFSLLCLITAGAECASAASYIVTDLGKLVTPTAINAKGQVVGKNGNTKHAFLYGNGTMTDLGTLGGSRSEAWGINASGRIVGSVFGSSGGYNGPFLYSDGTVYDLGTVPDGTGGGCAYGINAAGQITPALLAIQDVQPFSTVNCVPIVAK